MSLSPAKKRSNNSTKDKWLRLQRHRVTEPQLALYCHTWSSLEDSRRSLLKGVYRTFMAPQISSSPIFSTQQQHRAATLLDSEHILITLGTLTTSPKHLQNAQPCRGSPGTSAAVRQLFKQPRSRQSLSCSRQFHKTLSLETYRHISVIGDDYQFLVAPQTHAFARSAHQLATTLMADREIASHIRILWLAPAPCKDCHPLTHFIPGPRICDHLNERLLSSMTNLKALSLFTWTMPPPEFVFPRLEVVGLVGYSRTALHTISTDKILTFLRHPRLERMLVTHVGVVLPAPVSSETNGDKALAKKDRPKSKLVGLAINETGITVPAMTEIIRNVKGLKAFHYMVGVMPFKENLVDRDKITLEELSEALKPVQATLETLSLSYKTGCFRWPNLDMHPIDSLTAFRNLENLDIDAAMLLGRRFRCHSQMTGCLFKPPSSLPSYLPRSIRDVLLRIDSAEAYAYPGYRQEIIRGFLDNRKLLPSLHTLVFSEDENFESMSTCLQCTPIGPYSDMRPEMANWYWELRAPCAQVGLNLEMHIHGSMDWMKDPKFAAALAQTQAQAQTQTASW